MTGMAAKSIFIFGIYIIVVGIVMLFFPDPIVSIIRLQMPDNLAIRILGMLLIFYGYYYVRAGLKPEEMKAFYSWTTHTRSLAILFLSAFVLAGIAHPIVLIFGLIDLGGAVWTFFALRAEEKKGV
jgi:hypothetical protein